jgi:hypothetical protein
MFVGENADTPESICSRFVRGCYSHAMNGRFPRTAGEFKEHQRHVVLRCEACHETEFLDQDRLIGLVGPDFDLYDGYHQLRAMLSCWMCGQGQPALTFYDASKRPFGPYSFEESLTASLEMSAFVLARDGEDSRKGRGRVRKFGSR